MYPLPAVGGTLRSMGDDDTLFVMDPLWETSHPITARKVETWTPYLSDQVLVAHPQTLCEGKGRPCAVHAPSDHGMREWMQWYEDGCTYRVCSHGENHLDPDEIRAVASVQGCTVDCDGCCKPVRANDAFRKFDINQLQININGMREKLKTMKRSAEVEAMQEYAQREYAKGGYISPMPKPYDAMSMMLAKPHIYHVDIN